MANSNSNNNNIPAAMGFLIASIMVPLLTTTVVDAYVPMSVREMYKTPEYTYEKCVKLMEEYAEIGQNTNGDDPSELWWAFKYVDRNANDFYKTVEDRKALMDRCYGSWELRLACNDDRDLEFYPHPEFRSFATAFTTVAPDYFGKGISSVDRGFCFVALAGPTGRSVKRRQVYMDYEDYYINGQQVPGWDLSYYLRGWKRTAQGGQSDSFAGTVSEAEKKRPKLAFTVIFATDKAMAVRGSKTGGVAIFRKIPEDMTEVAYGFPPE